MLKFARDCQPRGPSCKLYTQTLAMTFLCPHHVGPGEALGHGFDHATVQLQDVPLLGLGQSHGHSWVHRGFRGTILGHYMGVI